MGKVLKCCKNNGSHTCDSAQRVLVTQMMSTKSSGNASSYVKKTFLKKRLVVFVVPKELEASTLVPPARGKVSLSLPSYIRDTSDLLLKLNGICLDDSMIFASIDVEALYSSIRHDLGLNAVEYYLSMRDNRLIAHNKLVLDLLNFSLTRNYFVFDDRHYHQLRGTAMGSSCAPSYANLLLGWWETNYIGSEALAEWQDKVVLWLRFIDDVFVLWRGTEESFAEFVMIINDNDLGLNFTSTCDKNALPFLDVLIERGMNQSIVTSVYCKSTAGNSLLRWDSAHPFPLRKGIPKGQYFRIRRNCSTMKKFKKQAADLRVRFRERGYPDEILRTAYETACSEKRDIKNVLSRHWDILKADPDLDKVLGSYPQITFRKGRSLRDRLVNSHFQPPERTGNWLSRKPMGTFKCGSCTACGQIKKAISFTCSSNNKEYYIKDFINCLTTGVVDLAQCTCPLDYVGKTKREFRRRIRDHVNDILNEKDTSVARHVLQYHGGNTNCLKFMGLQHVPKPKRGGDWDKMILQAETKWTYKLNSVTP
ncbi:uncharacterized protein LOC120990787 [Bufo bufo]|uniref:uncharacterized protein LOC120990787 n=1 Tax=Bufo bufo TaxID=8384 RepID=UPI001ABE3D5B|nr:uncharacterized protein LOC120990787 [Bufo bufo]